MARTQKTRKLNTKPPIPSNPTNSVPADTHPFSFDWPQDEDPEVQWIEEEFNTSFDEPLHDDSSEEDL